MDITDIELEPLSSEHLGPPSRTTGPRTVVGWMALGLAVVATATLGVFVVARRCRQIDVGRSTRGRAGCCDPAGRGGPEGGVRRGAVPGVFAAGVRVGRRAGTSGGELSPRAGTCPVPGRSIRPVCSSGRRVGRRLGAVGTELPPGRDQDVAGAEQRRRVRWKHIASHQGSKKIMGYESTGSLESQTMAVTSFTSATRPNVATRSHSARAARL